MDKLNINQTCGEQRIIIGKCRTLSIEERRKLDADFYIPLWRKGKNFLNAREEMEYIINNIFKKSDAFKTVFLDFIDVGIAHKYECGRGNVFQTNCGRGKMISMVNYTSGNALSCQVQGSFDKKMVMYFSDVNQYICRADVKSKLKRFYSPKSLNEFLITTEKENG